MKHLAILRHAKSPWDDPGRTDFNRPLNDRGWEASRRLGRELTELRLRFDLVIASPAARVRETLDGIQDEFQFSAPIRFEEQMYLAPVERLLAVIQQLPESARRPLFVGHNPGFQQILLELTNEDEEGTRARVAHKFPTASLAIVELPAQHWDEVQRGSGKIVELVRPKDLN